MLRFILVFVLCLVLLLGELLPFAQAHLVQPFNAGIAHVAAWLIGWFDPSVVAHDNEIRHGISGGGIAIVAACNGMEAVIILGSAVLAFPSPWKYKLAGIALGFLAIQALNLVRIVTLFYVHEWNHGWFEWFHLYLWPALIVLDALVFWLIWLRWLPRPASPVAT